MQVNKSKSLNLPLAIALLFLLLALFSSIMEWPFNFEMKLIGFLVVGFIYGTRYSLKVNKILKDRVKAYMIFSFVMVEVLSILNIKSAIYLSYFGLVCGIVWLILFLIDSLNKVKLPNQPNLVLSIGFIFIMLYVFSCLIDSRFTFISLVLGVFITALGFLTAHFKDVKSIKD